LPQPSPKPQNNTLPPQLTLASKETPEVAHLEVEVEAPLVAVEVAEADNSQIPINMWSYHKLLMFA